MSLPLALAELAPSHAELARQVVVVLCTDTLRLQLQRAARETALSFTPDKVTSQLEALLYSLAAYSKDLLQCRQMNVRELQAACLWAAEACSRRPTRGLT